MKLKSLLVMALLCASLLPLAIPSKAQAQNFEIYREDNSRGYTVYYGRCSNGTRFETFYSNNWGQWLLQPEKSSDKADFAAATAFDNELINHNGNLVAEKFCEIMQY